MRTTGFPYVSDFETTSVLNYDKEKMVRVWCWCIVTTKDHSVVARGIDIESFFEWIKKSKTCKIFFHNEAFDCSFIMDYALKHGFQHTTNRKLEVGEFSTLIDMLGKMYSLKINVGGKTITIVDSLKLLLAPVEKVARDFKLPIKKGSIDYVKYRPEGYEPTPEEWEYIETDCKVVSMALRHLIDKNHTKTTVASCALSYYKNIIGDNKFKAYFPELPLHVDDFIRKAYRGGYCCVNKKYAETVVENVQMYDVKSLYPSIMVNIGNNGLPYGKPKYFVGKYKKNYYRPLYIQHVNIAFELKKGYPPCIQIKRNVQFLNSEYLTTSNGQMIEMWFTNVDLEYIELCYETVIEYIDGYAFKAGKGMFDKYVYEWYEKKERHKKEGNEAEGQIDKIFLNGLSGKFGAKTKRRNKIPYLGDDGVVHFALSEQEESKPIYTAVIAFITAYGRSKIINTIIKHLKVGGCDKDRWVYTDTDSIHILADSETPIMEHGKKLGDFDYEKFATMAKYIRAKTYMYATNKGTIIKCAGLPKKDYEIDFTTFHRGKIFEGSKLRTKRVQGGILLLPTDFTIK